MFTPSVVGVLENEGKNEYYVDDMLQIRRDKMAIAPVTDKNGYGKFSLILVTDYNGLDTILKTMISDRLGLDFKEHPILLTEPSLHNKDHRTKMATHFFEKYQIPALFICKASVLAAFSCGRSTCLVLESGANTTYATPLQDGYAIQANMIKCDVGENYLTNMVGEALTKRGIKVVPRYAFTKKNVNGQIIVDYQAYDLTTPSYEIYTRQEIIRGLKESLLTLSADVNMEIGDAKTDYELPDGTKVNLESDAKKIPELMFTGNSEESGFMGVHKMIVEAITRTDLDIRKELYNNIVVTGGNTVIPGFIERVQVLVPEIAPTNTKVKIISHMTTERKSSPWIGGSILSSLGSFQQMWMSKQEFDENGSIMVERKCA